MSTKKLGLVIDVNEKLRERIDGVEQVVCTICVLHLEIPPDIDVTQYVCPRCRERGKCIPYLTFQSNLKLQKFLDVECGLRATRNILEDLVLEHRRKGNLQIESFLLDRLASLNRLEKGFR